MSEDETPADPTLWPGEKPFTAFGQWGEDHLDLRVFDQAEWWVDRHGVAHRLNDMSTDYRVNVVLHLRENAAYFHAGTVRRAELQRHGDALLGRPPAVPPQAASAADLDAATWLASTPLLARLFELIGE